jgi:hypothetical protein
MKTTQGLSSTRSSLSGVGFAVEAVLTFDFTHTIIEHILMWSRFFDFGKFT